ncbi:MAG: hypothetical protein PHC29_05125 [Candidatus Omnitrophica bacterium]|nr:hypothetical protein [Candidatus Omnitrophota bacterium]
MGKGDGKLIDRIQKSGVVLSIWKNPGVKDGKVVGINTFVINRCYLNKKDGKWYYPKDFKESDLPAIKEAIDEYLLRSQEDNTMNGS